MNIITWNTGRKYTANGQRIIATRLENGCVAFYDVDRMIAGVTHEACDLTQHAVMSAYDANKYADLYCGKTRKEMRAAAGI